MNSPVKNSVLAAFIADALSLGVHWVYDTSAIDNRYGRLEEMVSPKLAPYHKTRKKGEFTHYGDQMLLLLQSISQHSGFNIDEFGREWQNLFSNYTGYIDHATQETTENFKTGKTAGKSGSLSSDLAGAARIAPLAVCYSDNVEAFVDAARQQTAMTHNHPMVIESAELFAQASALVFNGETPVASLQKSLETMKGSSEIRKQVEIGIQSRKEDTRKAVMQFGQTCSVQAALPCAVHLIAKYESNLKDALIENIMAGGDSSARGMLAGFMIGAFTGLDNLPNSWTSDMPHFKAITKLLESTEK